MRIIKLTVTLLLVAGTVIFASNQTRAAFSDPDTRWGEKPWATGDIWNGEIFVYYQIVGVPVLPVACEVGDPCPIEISNPGTDYKDYVTKIFFFLKLTKKSKGKVRYEYFTGEGKINSSNLFYLLGGIDTGHQQAALNAWLEESVYPFLDVTPQDTSGAIKSVAEERNNIDKQPGGTYPPGSVLFVGAKVEIAVE